jgi:hypothetical protein
MSANAVVPAPPRFARPGSPTGAVKRSVRRAVSGRLVLLDRAEGFCITWIIWACCRAMSTDGQWDGMFRARESLTARPPKGAGAHEGGMQVSNLARGAKSLSGLSPRIS